MKSFWTNKNYLFLVGEWLGEGGGGWWRWSDQLENTLPPLVIAHNNNSTAQHQHLCHCAKLFKGNLSCNNFYCFTKTVLIRDNLIYIPNDDTQNYSFCRLESVVKTFELSTNEPTNWNLKVPKVVKQTNKKTLL